MNELSNEMIEHRSPMYIIVKNNNELTDNTVYTDINKLRFAIEKIVIEYVVELDRDIRELKYGNIFRDENYKVELQSALETVMHQIHHRFSSRNFNFIDVPFTFNDSRFKWKYLDPYGIKMDTFRIVQLELKGRL